MVPSRLQSLCEQLKYYLTSPSAAYRTTLETLHLRNLPFVSFGPETDFPALRFLSLENTAVNSRVLSTFPKLKALERLRMYRVWLGDYGNTNLINVLCNARSLRKLFIEETCLNQATTSDFNTLMRSLPYLEEMSFRHCRLRDSVWLNVVETLAGKAIMKRVEHVEPFVTPRRLIIGCLRRNPSIVRFTDNGRECGQYAQKFRVLGELVETEDIASYVESFVYPK